MLELGEIRAARVIDPSRKWVLFIWSDALCKDKRALCWVHEAASEEEDGLFTFLDKLIAMLRTRGFSAHWFPARIETVRSRMESWQWPKAPTKRDLRFLKVRAAE